MPFSYVYIDGIVADDSQPHNVQVYSDISSGMSEPFCWIIENLTKIYTMQNGSPETIHK